MKFNIYMFIATSLFAGNLVFAQETRAPIEKYSFEVEATSPAGISASVDATGKIAVWSNYSEKRDLDGNYLSFTAKKFQIFEQGKRIKTTQDIKNIPRDNSVGVKQISSSDGIWWTPSGGIERDNKITFKGMTKLGFAKDTFIVGPFEYTIRWARPLGVGKAGFMYVIAECSKPNSVPVKESGERSVFRMLYKISKGGQLVDKFAYDEAQYVERSGMGARYPWIWHKENVHIDENGSFYAVKIGSGKSTGTSQVYVERWATK